MMAYYSKRHYRSLSNGGADTPAQVAERINRRRAGELAIKDRESKFPNLTPANAQEAIDYQSARLEYHFDVLSKSGLPSNFER